ncbi:uncharacterized protein CLUP02_00097 [Colletotrichum lupini]|uniref:Uncharacterized protein n=1 Tax=Colletotrichum lupini TaxID=145971 RepID=A0A9Q8SAB9_9PEZI|nr:uncharacterized protein CLUP02_00097 [Colletotrichum lupini]UQC73453.1 hypothetical protein CLUP02_00097 [Colletotrichum lupini]
MANTSLISAVAKIPIDMRIIEGNSDQVWGLAAQQPLLGGIDPGDRSPPLSTAQFIGLKGLK